MGLINVLHLRDTHEIGGPGKTILETHRAIDPERFRMHVAVFLTRREDGMTPFVAAARQLGIPVHMVWGFNQYDPFVITRLARLARTLRVDIIHAHEVKSDVIAYLASRLYRVPIVTTLHGWIGHSRRHRALISLDKRMARRFDRVIAVSTQIRNELVAAGVSAERVRVLHNAIAVERYRRSESHGFLTGLIGKPLPGPVIASVGRLSREKGHLDLIDALKIVADRGHIASAVIAGDGPERDTLLERIRSLGLEQSVHLLGHVSQPERILQETDLMVLPSHTEGLPNVVLEALAMQVPVLGTRVGGTPEIVEDGKTGRLVAARSPEALAGALIEFLADPISWRHMAQNGREVVETRFNFRHRTLNLERIYLELTSEGKR